MDDKRTNSQEETYLNIPEGQISLREYMAGAENMRMTETFMPETGQRRIDIQADFKEGMDHLVPVERVTFEKMLEAGLSFEKKRALLQAVWDAHPDDPFIDALPASLVTLTATLYLRENGLEEVKQEDIEAHRAPYLQFFQAFIDVWKAIGGETRKDQEEVFKELGQVLRDKGLIKSQTSGSENKPPLADLTPDFIYGSEAIMPISILIKKQAEIAKANGDLLGLNAGGEGEENAVIHASITTDKEISTAAIEVQNVIGELMQANGNKPISITKAQIYRAFAIIPNKSKVTDKALEFIGETIETLREAKGQIDFTQQVEKHKKMKRDKSFDYNKAILKGDLVLADEKTIIAGGHETEGYTFYRLPLYYMHSHLTGQITRIDRALLDTTAEKITDGTGKKHKVEARQNDISFILLKRYLAREVESMKSNKGNPENETRRSFETIADAIDLKKPVKDKDGKETKPDKLTARQLRTLRENIEFLCTRWKIQGNIKDYELYKKKGCQAYAGVKIEV